jgi:type I restriction-modification system DNA methylase subunit
MSQKPMPIPEPEADETQSNISETPSVTTDVETPSVISGIELSYPVEHFDAEYLSAQTLDTLKTMKKTCKIRAKTTETIADYTRVISEWYLKKADKPKRSRKPAKASSTAVTNTALNLDLSGLVDVNTETVVSLTDVTNLHKANKPRGKKTNLNRSQTRSYKVPVNIIHKIDTGIDTTQGNSLTPIQSWLKKTHDYLYSQENIVGVKAMNDIMSMLFLTIIQDKITDTEQPGMFDLLNINKYINCDDKTVNKHASLLNKQNDVNYIAMRAAFTRFIKLDWIDTTHGPLIRNDKCLIKQYGRFLTVHPQTKSIFKVENFLHCQKGTTIKGLIKCVNEFVKEHVKPDNDKLKHEDLIGEIYEYFINNYQKADNKLGQFFTPRKMMMSILKFKESDIRDNLTELTTDNPNRPVNVWDPCMGTGGWLVSAYNMFGTDHNDSKRVFNINPAGNDVETDTLRMGIMNVMNVKQDIQLERFSEKNSLTNSVDNWIVDGVSQPNSMDLITTNPPFGASGKDDVETGEATKKGKGAKVSSLEYEYNDAKKKPIVNMGAKLSAEYNTQPFEDVYFLKDKNMPIQFMEMCIHRLKEGGMCAIVLPYGELFFSSSYAKARAHFMKIIDITDIVLYPSGVFTHTGIKSCCVIFRKDSINGTKAIKFYKSNKDCNEFTEITTLTRDDINEEPTLSWYLNDYLEDMYVRELMGKIECEWVAFGDMFDLVGGNLESGSIEEDKNGDGMFIIKSKKGDMKQISSSKYKLFDGEHCFISNLNPVGLTVYYNGKCNYSNLMCELITKQEYIDRVNKKYIHYYINEMTDYINTNYEYGACKPRLDEKNFLTKFKIPIPSAEIQQHIVEYYDTLTNCLALELKYKNAELDRKKGAFQFTLLAEANQDYCEWIAFGDVFDLVKGTLQSSKVEEDPNGDGVFITKDSNPNNWMKFKSKYDDEGLFIACVSNGNHTVPINYYKGKYDYNNLLLKCIPNQKYNSISIKYVYYYMIECKKHIEELYQKGACTPSLDEKNFLNKFKIPIIPIERQNLAIQEMDEFDAHIKNIDWFIEKSKSQLKNKFFHLLRKHIHGYGN